MPFIFLNIVFENLKKTELFLKIGIVFSVYSQNQVFDICRLNEVSEKVIKRIWMQMTTQKC